MNYRIVHIHTDPKFFSDVHRYEGAYFENTLLFIGLENPAYTDYMGAKIIFHDTLESIDKIVKYISSFNLIVFVDLTSYNKKILLKTPKNLKVIWRFFGHELYNKRFDLMLSQTSIAAANNEYKIYTRKGGIKAYYIFLKRKYASIRDLYKYQKHIDYILLTSKEEHAFLKKHWIFIPRFLKLPIRKFPNYETKSKENFYIFGHSRNVSNNHIDILNIINHSQNNSPYKTKMFLSYGYQKNYFNKVVENIACNPNIEMITNFMPREEFAKTYIQASALVINSYRQMALGNIFIAISNNCKIYLNKKNPIKQWLEREGMKIFSIEEFKMDYDTNNLVLSEENAKHNVTILINMYEEYSLEHFQKKILEIVKR